MLIKVENLTLSYENMTVIENLNFEVADGDYLCIVGENGSGKSTLVKALLSLKKPEKGSITFGEGLKKNEIGYLPQQTAAQKDFPASVYEVVISGCLNSRGIRPFYSSRERKKALENMELLGITELKNRSYRELSGGQQQRVAIARAIAADPEIILADEPCGNLDSASGEEILGILAALNRAGKTIVMITHNEKTASRAQRLVRISDGRIV
ncbi:MAG TPA: ABC transporter [Ruminococcaceae bacterium]|nr:ABC transporter [Oscillospiraceae bacterium]